MPGNVGLLVSWVAVTFVRKQAKIAECTFVIQFRRARSFGCYLLYKSHRWTSVGSHYPYIVVGCVVQPYTDLIPIN